MQTILQNSLIPGAVECASTDDQRSTLDEENVDRNAKAMRDKNSEELSDWSDFNWESFEAFNTSRVCGDLDSIVSGTRTDGDCSETEAINSVYESDNRMQRPSILSSSRPCFGVESNDRVVIPPQFHPLLSANSQVQGVLEHSTSWRDDWGESGSEKGNGEWNVEVSGDRKPEAEVLDWFRANWNWDYIEAYNSSGTDEMQGNKYREDIDSIVSGTNTDGCSENEASTVHKSTTIVQRPGIFSSEDREGLEKNSWGDIGQARRHHKSISGAPQAANQHISSNALSADLLMDNCDEHRCSSTSEGENVDIVHSAPEMILKEAIHPIGRNVAYQREAHTSKREKASENVISHESLSQHFGRSLDDARKSFGVSRTAFKTMCRDVGIMRWKYGKKNMGHNSSKTRRRVNDEVPGRNFSAGMPPVQDTPIVAHNRQDLNTMTVKATYNGERIRFKLSDISGKSELEDNVIKRLQLERNTFTIQYLDDDSEWILISFDEDLQECRDILRSSENTTIKMLIRHQPGDHVP